MHLVNTRPRRLLSHRPVQDSKRNKASQKMVQTQPKTFKRNNRTNQIAAAAAAEAVYYSS